MGDNPFNEPDDNDRTVIRPRPGGRRAAAPARPAAPTEAPTEAPVRPPPARTTPPVAAQTPIEPAAADIAELSAGGLSPLLASAAPLLQLLARLRNTARAPDAGDLHARAAGELRGFAQRAEAAGIAKDQLRTAHYALCASIDDVVLNTPWGAGGGWGEPLVSLFHAEIKGDRFFDLLERVSRDSGRFQPVIELMYLCLSLGYQGRTRGATRGAEALEAARAKTYDVIAAQLPVPSAGLSQDWVGVSAPYQRARGGMPVWVVGAAALVVIAGLFVWTSTSLNAASDAVFDKMLHAPPDRMPVFARPEPVAPPPPPPAPAEPGVLDTLRAAFRPEIDRGLLSVVGTEAMPIVRVRAGRMFSPGTANVQASFRPVLERVGTVLKDQPGPVSVLAYTDSEPVHTVKFGSNFQLSAAQAAAVRAVVAHAIGDAGRLTAEGRADADPIAPNTSAENRDLNRRIDVVLRRPI